MAVGLGACHHAYCPTRVVDHQVCGQHEDPVEVGAQEMSESLDWTTDNDWSREKWERTSVERKVLHLVGIERIELVQVWVWVWVWVQVQVLPPEARQVVDH